MLPLNLKMESQDGGGQIPSPPFAPRPQSRDSSEDEDEQVMSEIHLGCPPARSGPHISRFVISLPYSIKDEPFGMQNVGTVKEGLISASEVCDLDEDGDLILTRRSKVPRDHFEVTIRHKITSSIPRVGLQVWRAELVLADFLLHKMFTSPEFDGIVAVELGAGTGFVGLLLARVAQTVFITDHGEVLDNCVENVKLNAGIFHPSASVYVRELDWNCSGHPQVIKDSQFKKRHSWTVSEVEEFHEASLLVAADVIYSDDLTDAFFSTLERIMSEHPEKVLYLALEKRYNFTLDDLNVVANGYSHFQSYLREGDCDDLDNESLRCFLGECVDLTEIPQYVRDYERGNDVELWQIKYVKKRKP